MTYEETRQILTVLRTAYPQSFLRWNKEQGEAFLELWSKGLAEEKQMYVLAAVWHFITDTDREFAPTLGMVRSYINETPQYMLEADLVKYFPDRPDVKRIESDWKRMIES